MLVAHMARLAQADQIASGIRGFCVRKKPKGFDVVDGEALPNVDAAFGAKSGLIPHDSGAGHKPTSPPIGSRPSDPIRSLSPFGLCGTSASDGAKARDSILSDHPGLLPESHTAIFAFQVKPGLPAMVRLAPHILRAKGVGRSQPRAKPIADQVGLGRGVQECLGLPARTARSATKARLRRPVGLNRKAGLADFAGHMDHANNIAQPSYMDKRTALIAPRPVQEGLPL
jgi:hypothetical protein